MSSYSDSWRYLKLEARAERRAVLETDETAYIEIIRQDGIETEWHSFETKKDKKRIIVGKVDVNVRAQDIFNVTTWAKFLKHIGKNDADLISLIDHEDFLTTAYDRFLDENHTERYQNLDASGKIWRFKIVRRAVKWHILKNKLDGYLAKETTFADDRVAYYLKLTRAIKKAMGEIPQLIYHMVEDKEQARHYIDLFFERHYKQFQNTPFPQRDELLHLMNIDENEPEEKIREIAP